jgi:hypothetical protein
MDNAQNCYNYRITYEGNVCKDNSISAKYSLRGSKLCTVMSSRMSVAGQKMKKPSGIIGLRVKTFCSLTSDAPCWKQNSSSHLDLIMLESLYYTCSCSHDSHSLLSVSPVLIRSRAWVSKFRAVQNSGVRQMKLCICV